RINIMSSSIALLPTDLFQLYLLYFNLTFKSLAHFHTVSPIISTIIASLKPLDFNDIYSILNSSQPEPYITRDEVAARLAMLTPMIVKLSNDKYAPLHPTFREWVIKMSDQTDYAIDIRQGHILHSLFLVRKGNLTPELFFELGHHLLKANPYKYMRPGTAPDLPNGKDCHILWIQKAAGHPSALQNSLLYERNCYYPNSKVSRLLLLSGANTNCCWPDGSCLLNTFAHTGNVTMIQLLLQFNVDVNFANPKTGQTPIFSAVQKSHLDAVQILYEHGAKVNIYDNND
uniref:Uncharacterized protein n=1 Tax=Panagrolaimus sp. PS1159 TaxID=55785 RepID=A0AC35FVV0_9BILA